MSSAFWHGLILGTVVLVMFAIGALAWACIHVGARAERKEGKHGTE